MKYILVFILITALFSPGVKSQSPPVFDSVEFNNRLQLAQQLVDYEYILQVSLDKLKLEHDISGMDWFCFYGDNTWHTVGTICTNREFPISSHVTVDSMYNVTQYKDNSDTAKLFSSACALSLANSYFQLIRDTTSIYFNSFVWHNSDGLISIWFLPAFQPSGQAIYGCEWEYVFNKTGAKLLRTNSHTENINGVWIGQPREVWLNYRNTDAPTVGSLFFALSFRDYFTRFRIDTKKSTSTTAKDSNGKYTWSHKMK